MTVDVLLYVVNANERGRFKESRAELQRIIHEEEFRDALKLVILNVHRPEDSNRVGASEARKIHEAAVAGGFAEARGERERHGPGTAPAASGAQT